MQIIYVDINNLEKFCETAPDAAIALGYFDGVHLGHQKVIEAAKQKAQAHNYATAVLSFFPHPKSVLCNEDVQYLEPIEQKAEKLENLGVDIFYIVEFTKELANVEPDAFLTQYIVALNAKEIVCGFDYSYGKKAKGDVCSLKAYTKKRSIGLTVVDEFKWNDQKVSSTLIRGYLNERNLTAINTLLGESYKIKYCRKNGVLPHYSLPNIGRYKVLIEHCNAYIECIATVTGQQFIHLDQELAKLPNLLTIRWIEQFEKVSV